jgi:hypothetical protein
MKKGTVSVTSLRFFSGVAKKHMRYPPQVQALPVPNRRMMTVASLACANVGNLSIATALFGRDPRADLVARCTT